MEEEAPHLESPGRSPDDDSVVDADLRVPVDVLECPRCMEASDELDALLERIEHFDPAVATETFDADRRFDELIALPTDLQALRVVERPEYRSWALCQLFLAESSNQWRQDPVQAHSRATIGLVIALALDAERYFPQWVADLRAKAHAYLGNCYRVLGDFEEADRELQRALALLRDGVGSGLREARVLSLHASLLTSTGRHDAAENVLSRVEDYYRRTGQRAELARAQLKHARILAYRSEYRAAAEQCASALNNIDPREEAGLATIAWQNAAHYLVHGGDVERARSLFASLAPTHERRVALHRKWIEADLLRAEGRLSASLSAYDEARSGYAAMGLSFDVALITLDQALTAEEMGDHGAMSELAQAARLLLDDANAPTEIQAAMLVLTTAIERGTASRSILAAIRKRVADARPTR
jgi:tetratricopeptide (TPR) repeat protein